MRSATVIVGTLKDGYVRNVPLTRVQWIQSASDYTKTTQSQVDASEYASGKGTPCSTQSSLVGRYGLPHI